MSAGESVFVIAVGAEEGFCADFRCETEALDMVSTQGENNKGERTKEKLRRRRTADRFPLTQDSSLNNSLLIANDFIDSSCENYENQPEINLKPTIKVSF